MEVILNNQSSVEHNNNDNDIEQDNIALISKEEVEEDTFKNEYVDEAADEAHGIILSNIDLNESIGHNNNDDDDDEFVENALPKDIERHLSYYVLISHLITRSGDRAWSFIVPLILIYISPKSLIPTSLYGLSNTIARILLGPTIGDLTDRYKKLFVIRIGVLGQATAIGLSCALLKLIMDIESTELQRNIFYSSKSSVLFIILLFCSSIHSLSCQIMDISVERKWVPSFIKRDKVLHQVNTRMRQIDLATEVISPFITGLISNPSMSSFLIIGIYNFISFFPQYFLLSLLYKKAKANNLDIDIKQQAAKHIEITKLDNNQYDDNNLIEKITTTTTTNNNNNRKRIKFLGRWNPLTNIIKGWTLFYQQTVFWIVLSYVLLWFTLLSPHDPVLTAYLSLKGYDFIELSIFRGIGAVLGLLATLSFNSVLKWFNNNLEKTCLYYISEEGLMLILSGISFMYIESMVSFKYLFLLFIVLSRMGLYAFEVGEIHFVQKGVDDKIRGIVSGVESSLCSLASLTVFAVTISLGDPKYFNILVWLSVSFINIGVIITFYYYFQLKIKEYFNRRRHAATTNLF